MIMARKAILEGGKRDEILKAALKLFLANGYEGTSVRMILEQVGGEIGMFYHYFSSKQELFDKAFELFMKMQGEWFSSLMSQESDTITPRMRLEQLWECYANGMNDFAKLSGGDTIHWSVLYAIHDLTIKAMLPSFRTMIIHIFQTAGKDNYSESEWLAPFVLSGISGLLHDKSFAALTKDKQILLIVELICRTLQVPHSVFDL